MDGSGVRRNRDRERATSRKYEYKKCIKELAKHNRNSDSSNNPNFQVVVS